MTVRKYLIASFFHHSSSDQRLSNRSMQCNGGVNSRPRQASYAAWPKIQNNVADSMPILHQSSCSSLTAPTAFESSYFLQFIASFILSILLFLSACIQFLRSKYIIHYVYVVYIYIISIIFHFHIQTHFLLLLLCVHTYRNSKLIVPFTSTTSS